MSAAGALSPPRPGLPDAVPHLGRALDGGAAEAFQSALVGGANGYRLERCGPGRARALPDGGCTLRYEVAIAGIGGDTTATIVTARLFHSLPACRRYVANRLRPLAARARGRPELRMFAAPVAAIEELRMAASAFPIDADLPTLLNATDPLVVAPLFGVAPGRCAVTLVRYGRGNRCILRYEAGPQVALGKVSDDGRGARARRVMEALRSKPSRTAIPRHFDVPRPLGYAPRLRLLLLAWTPGAPRLSELLRARIRGERPARAEIERAIETCAVIAAELHGSGIRAGRPRPIATELHRLAIEIAAIERAAPELGGWLVRRLAAARAHADGSPTLPPCLCHGDFKHNQVLFDADRRTLVDFDTVCDAEPALDLGHFLGYLRLKARDGGAGPLCDRFLDAYLDAAGGDRAWQGAVRDRVAVYEALTLLGRAVHSYQKFKPERLAAIAPLLDERTAWLTG